jgi:nucleoside-diphosphate-sugar epimerase
MPELKKSSLTPRILVTGGSGFIGSSVLQELSRRGIETHALSRTPPPSEPRANITWHACDLLSAPPILTNIQPTHCLHLAWEATPNYYRTAVENYDWAAASIRLARAFFATGGTSFTMAGSCAEYARTTDVCDEVTTPDAGDCAYALCKSETARIIASLAQDIGAKFSCGRIFYAYGESEAAAKLIATLCRGLASGAEIPLTEGSDVVDYIFHTDVAHALIELCLSEVSGIVNIGSGEAVLVRDIAAALGELSGRPELLQFGKVPMNRPPVKIVAATHRLFHEVGYQPQVPLKVGLRRCYNSGRA